MRKKENHSKEIVPKMEKKYLWKDMWKTKKGKYSRIEDDNRIA